MAHIMKEVNSTLKWLKGATEASAELLTERRYELEDVVMPKIRYLLSARIMDEYGNEIPAMVNGEEVVCTVDPFCGQEQEANFMFFEAPIVPEVQADMRKEYFKDDSSAVDRQYPGTSFTDCSIPLDVEMFEGKPSIELKYVVPPAGEVEVKQEGDSANVDDSFSFEYRREFKLVPVDPFALQE